MVLVRPRPCTCNQKQNVGMHLVPCCVRYGRLRRRFCAARKVNNNKIDEKRSNFGSAQPMTHNNSVQKEAINGALATWRQ
jgi:hypothetical protein